MPRSSRDEEFSAFVQTRRTGLVRSVRGHGGCAVRASRRQSPFGPGRLWRWQAPIAQRIERLPPKQ